MPKNYRRHLVAIGLACPVLAVGLVPLSASAAPTASQSYVVRFVDGTDAKAKAEKASGDGMRVARVYSHALSGMAADLTPAQAARLASDPSVASIERDARARAFGTETAAPWGLDRIDQAKLPLSGTYTWGADGAGVKAYVIDTGVWAGHADLAGRVATGYDAVDLDGDATDCHGHGTHVAGTVAGTTYGVAKGATVVPVRVLDCSGFGTTSEIIAGIDWAVEDHGTEPAVANMSLGGSASQAIDAAVQALIDDGVTLAVAAGNDFANGCLYSPARVRAAITVSASTITDHAAAFSSTGPCVDLFAPGENITSAGLASPTASLTMSGTSMATPHVTGAAAILAGQHPTWTPAQISAAIVKSATKNALTGVDRETPNKLLRVG